VSTVDLVTSLLRLVAAVAPGVLAAITGQGSDEDAIEAARERVEALPVRSGDDGAWADDLRRRERGDEPTQP
jgi:hypothetical protein